MYCKKCGTKIKSGYVFCPICGALTRVDISRNKEVDMEILSKAIEHLKAGNEDGFSLIYFHTYKYVYNRAKYMVKDEQEAQDLTQDVYIALYKSINEIKDERAIFGWLKTVVFRQSLKFIEKKKKCGILEEEDGFLLDTLSDESIKIEETYDRKEDIRTVKKCIDMLSEDQRLVILAYYYDNMSVREIATVLEISEGTVKSRLYLARKHLMIMLEAEEKKQGYKFFSAGIPMFMPALETTLKANNKIAKETVVSNYKNFCTQAGVEETPALVKTTGIPAKAAEIIAGVGFKKIIITIASFIVVGGTFGAIIISGGNAVDDISKPQEAEKAGRQVELSEIQDTEYVESADDAESNGTSDNVEIERTAATESSETGTESGQTATKQGNTEENIIEKKDKPEKMTAVSGLKYNYGDTSDDLDLSWQPVDGADGYEVYVATSEFPTYKLDSTVSGTKCTVVTGGTYYHAKVRAYMNNDGKKEYGPFCSEISTEPNIAFPQSINVSSASADGDWVAVKVTPFVVDYYSEIILYRSSSADGNYESVGKTKCGPGQTITVSEIYDVNPGKEDHAYYYKIRIKAFKTWPGKSDRYSNYSNVISYK